MADAAIVGVLLENLQQQLLFNAELIGDANDQFEGLHRNLIMFKAFIRDFIAMRSSSVILQELVNVIKDVVYKAEDAIDSFVVEKEKFNARSSVRKALYANTDYLAEVRAIEKEIEWISRQVKEIYEQKLVGFEALQLEKPLAVEEDNDLEIEFDEVMETLINRLVDVENQDQDIITIIGMPGFGKTTLARKVYNDPAIEYVFFTRVWVYVSQNYSSTDVFRAILSTFKQESDYTNKSDEEIADDLRKFLEKAKYLIVLDDVWTTDAWDDLKNAFPKNNSGSRILITSRHKEVALHANANQEPLELKFLTAAKSWELLESRVFGEGKCPKLELKTLGEEIVSICHGFPYAIEVIAGILLSNRESYDWWNEVAHNVRLCIYENDEHSLIHALSYLYLPYRLKSCFLYLGVFPEDYEIPVRKLINLWIAEGFVEHNGRQSLEDIAEACMRDLVKKNLLMAATRTLDGQIKTCRVHDMLYEFCEKEARRQNFYKEIKRFDKVTSENDRRVSIHSNVMDYIISKPRGQRVRSFVCFPLNDIILPREHISTIPIAFEVLRVLDIISITFDAFPMSLLRLLLLRYIAITCNIKTLPKNISNLFNLQTLILKTDKRTLELKQEIWELYQLRHLHTNSSALLPPPPSNTLKGRENVQSLSMVSPESCTEHVFARTPNITKLGVRGDLSRHIDDLFENIGKLNYVANLKLFNDVDTDSPLRGKIPGLPQAYKFPSSLKKLTLSNTLLDWEQMQVLGSLEKLEVLKLKNNAFNGEIWETKDGSFISLKFLHIGWTNLVTWKASKHSFPCLKRLALRHCEDLDEVPYSFADINSFQILELYHTNPRAAPSARRIQHKKQMKASKENKSSGVFMLSVYPPEM